MSAKILIVDDEPLNLEILCEYFEGVGYELTVLNNGEAAWAALKKEQAHFDLAILDRMMPGLDGIALLKLIKSDPLLFGLPVIMQTAASSPEQLREGLHAGAYYYLTKPYERDSLLSIARAALSDAATKADLRKRLSEHNHALQLMNEASFEFRTIEEAGRLAAFLAHASAQPDGTILGLSELFVNSVEHGNLGISYAEKAELKRLDQWQKEVQRRAALPENRHKRVSVLFSRKPEGLSIRISDQGLGFEWEKYLEFDPERAFDPNGRGIALARLTSFDRLDYQGCGNVVVATILNKKKS
ncbi:MAG: response regulator [Pseudomonadota bacterium]